MFFIARGARLRPPDSLTSNGGPAHPSTRSQGNPVSVPGRRNTDGPPPVAGSQLLVLQGTFVYGLVTGVTVTNLYSRSPGRRK